MKYHLGMAYYYKSGEKELARKGLGKALELDPKFSGAEGAKHTVARLK
jgi:tetratricopeptide (TPR) repeat protein